MPMRSCRAVPSRRESTDNARGQRTSHSQRAQATTCSLTLTSAPPVSDGRRRCSHGVSAVWPCVAPTTWSRSQEYTSSIAPESSPRRVRGRAASVATHPENSRRDASPSVASVAIGLEDCRIAGTIGERSLDRGAKRAISVRCRAVATEDSRQVDRTGCSAFLVGFTKGVYRALKERQ